ncbi:hypothetical protein BKA70DRAFT_1562822 [Coprinopsis sp. MPI-PUGE-AT-0042]|nr:hypothetical protein BKA70DRAFT_1562822 [Coprinopsis sp. MPI-PUGE-AT-0042]
MKHRKRQKGSSAHTAKQSSLDHLSNAIFLDILPTDSATNEIWGFNRAIASLEGTYGRNCLLGVYQGLVKFRGIRPQQLDQWRQNGILLPEIKKVFEAIPENRRGAYYPWLSRNEYVLDRSQPIPSSNPDDVARRFMRSGWNYATNGRPATDEAIRTTFTSWPPHKHECLVLCGLLLHSYSPPPEQALWLQFGFCVGDRQSEMVVADMYSKLLSSASFDEFHHAYENAQLVDLLSRKGLTQSAAYRRIADEFEDVVGGSARGVLKSAWYLKVFIRVNSSPLAPGGKLNMEQSVFVDYGWMNCKNTHDINRLLHLYQQYFNSPGANCLELHSACINGRLVECLENCSEVMLSKQCKQLLKNFYPLSPSQGRLDVIAQSGLVFLKPAAKPSSSGMTLAFLVAFLVAAFVFYFVR